MLPIQESSRLNKPSGGPPIQKRVGLHQPSGTLPIQKSSGLAKASGGLRTPATKPRMNENENAQTISMPCNKD